MRPLFSFSSFIGNATLTRRSAVGSPARHSLLLGETIGAQSSAEKALRSTLRPPLYGGGQGVVGTLKLDAELSRGNCSDAHTRSDIWCCLYSGLFRVPWPCNCCGADCCCCPHSPRGPAWEMALAAGFGQLLAEAGAIATAMRPFASGDSVSVLVLLGTAREAALTPWVIRANEFLRPHSLSVAVYNWIEQTRDDKGNQTGEILRCAVQVYAGPGPQAMLTAQPVAYAAASHGGQLVYQPAAEQFLNPQQYSHQVYPAGYAGAQHSSTIPAGYAGAPRQLY